MRILLADDQRDVRSGLKILLEQQAHMDIVGEAAGTAELLDRAKALQPDLVLLDWELPGQGEKKIIPQLRECCPKLKIVALSARPEAGKAAMSSGADGFVSKSDQPDRLLEIINEFVARGEGTCNLQTTN